MYAGGRQGSCSDPIQLYNLTPSAPTSALAPRSADVERSETLPCQQAANLIPESSQGFPPVLSRMVFEILETRTRAALEASPVSGHVSRIPGRRPENEAQKADLGFMSIVCSGCMLLDVPLTPP